VTAQVTPASSRLVRRLPAGRPAWKAALLVLLFASAAHAAECSARVDVRDLPLVELPAKTKSDRFAVMLSGDGGWRRIDDKVTDKLRAEGVPVVGFLTPDYFKVRRTPQESACALERVIRFHQIAWKRDNVVLIGYSRGADILPFMASRLPDDILDSLSGIALLGLESTIDFKYHPSWIPFIHWNEPQYQVAPEVEKLRGEKILCFFGEKEKDSICRTLDPTLVTSVPEPGAHHFGGNYKGIAETILAATAASTSQ
jgi:type IV secretory pathway VirJ component